jgi:hypothetical protein
MRVIETTAHVGSDGVLRLAVPVAQRDRDVHVALVVDSAGPAASASPADTWASVRPALEIAGIRVPPPGVDNPGAVKPLSLPGPSASEMLIRDRR